MSGWAPLFPIVSSAILLALAYPGFELHYLAWVALVPLFIFIRTSGPGRAFLFSWSSGFLFYIVLLWWTIHIEGMNVFNFSLLNLGIAWHFGAFGLGAHYVQRRIPCWSALTFPAIWVILEYARTHAGFLSVPFGVIGYTQYRVLPVAAISAYAGVYGVSFLVVAVNSVFAEVVLLAYSPRHPEPFPAHHSRRNPRLSLGILVSLAILISASLLHGEVPGNGKAGESPSLKVALIQGNTFWEGKGDNLQERFDRCFGKYRDLSRSIIDSRPGLVIWPSSSVPGRIPFDSMLVRLLAGVARGTGAFLLIGTAGFDKFRGDQNRISTNRIANSAFLFSPQGDIVGRYDKIRLLPFDEYLPLRGYVNWPSWIVSSEIADYQPGREMTVFRAGDARFAVPICSENLLPEQFRMMAAKGVDFVVSMTNEGFAKSETGHHQLLAMNVLRAIENRVAIARTDTTGVSCLIGPDGRITAKVQDPSGNDVNVEGSLVGIVPLSRERSFYHRQGDIFMVFLTGLLIAVVSGGRLKMGDTGPGETPAPVERQGK